VPFELKAATADSTRAWLHFVQVFVITLGTALAVIYLLILILDPYDSGRITHNIVFGVVDENPRTASASRGRDPTLTPW